MFGALAFYTYAVFSGRKEGLRLKHLTAFGTGLLLDYLGTHQMNLLQQIHGKVTDWHNYTGALSLWGMAFHFFLALLATVFGRARQANRVFHKVSVIIYALWLFAFISGAIAGTGKMISIK
jgi:uncharacterized repeat protein (TIGR03987 family)